MARFFFSKKKKPKHISYKIVHDFLFIKMPFKKQYKPKTAVKLMNLRKHNIAIKKRLIEISVRVDAYIYKNKPITVEEAQNYEHEISFHRSQCNNDIRILQVIEKLTRCLKIIIEETTKKIPLNQNVTASRNGQSIDLFSETSFLNNKLEGNNTEIDSTNPRATVVVSKNNDRKSNYAVASLAPDNVSKETSGKDNTISSICIRNLKYITTECQSDLNLNHESNESKFYMSSISQENMDKTKQLQTYQTDSNKNITYTPIEVMNVNSNLILENSENNRKHHEKNVKTVRNTQRRSVPSIKQYKTKKSKKKNDLEVTLNPLTLCDTSHLNAAVNTKNTQQKINNRQTKKNTGVKLSDAKNKNKKSTTKKKFAQTNFKELSHPLHPPCPPTKKHTQINVINHELSLPMLIDDKKAIEYALASQDFIEKEMSALKINNEYVLNDLSWVDNIKYVREISAEELEHTQRGYDEVFWENFSLPSGWNNVDFLD